MLNLYKTALLLDCITKKTPYSIFHWSDKSIESKSDPIWLYYHLIVSLTLMTSTVWSILKEYTFAHTFIHYIFCGIMLFNLANFYPFRGLSAIMINTIPLLLMSILLTTEWKYRYYAYFMILTIPVLMEGSLMLYRMLMLKFIYL